MARWPPSLRAGRVGRLTTSPAPARVWATDPRQNSSTGTTGSSAPCCLLLHFSVLFKEPGEQVRLRDGTGSPQHAHEVADCWSRAPSLSCHLLFKIKVVGDTGPQQDFLRGVGGRAWETQLMHSNILSFFKTALVVVVAVIQLPWTAAHRLLCPSLSPGVCSDSCPLSQ